jgi:hypothetical protein
VQHAHIDGGRCRHAESAVGAWSKHFFSVNLDQVEDGAQSMLLKVLVKPETVRFRKLFSFRQP